MPEIVINVSPDGKVVTGLYSDNIPYRELGDCQIERASEVFFDSSINKWKIKILAEDRVLAPGFGLRSEAISYEIKYLNKKLEAMHS